MNKIRGGLAINSADKQATGSFFADSVVQENVFLTYILTLLNISLKLQIESLHSKGRNSTINIHNQCVIYTEVVIMKYDAQVSPSHLVQSPFSLNLSNYSRRGHVVCLLAAVTISTPIAKVITYFIYISKMKSEHSGVDYKTV